jgi:diguanylate cyclase (GGDEF)-like protein
MLTFAERAGIAMRNAHALDQAQKLSVTDSVTALPNHRYFHTKFDEELEKTKESGSSITVMMIDLDRFKVYNDSFGHAAGDELLVTVAERIRGCLSQAATAARLGGDEFAVLLEGTTGSREGGHVARRIIDALRAPLTLQGQEFTVSASIGIASGDDVGADELLRQADEAMYRAKRQGKGRYEVFEPGMGSEAAKRLELEAELQRAVERGDLLLHYQPIVDLAGEEIVGLEALVRLEDPRGGLVPPGEFIPLAEETGLILDIGRWVLEEACRQAAAWQAEHHPLSISVNLSGLQLQQPHVVAEVAETVERTRLAPGSLLLEITESVLMHDTQAIVAKLGDLRQLGIRLAIDDFGTGYSSLRYLQRFPIDILKVAKPFVDGLAGGGQESPVARAIVDLARALGLGTIAEGIEEQAQAMRLRGLGCALGQGYLYGRPLDADAISELLRSSRKAQARLAA